MTTMTMMTINRMMTKVATVAVGFVLMLSNNNHNVAYATSTTTKSSTTTYEMTDGGVPEGGTKYPHFIAMNDTMTCVGDIHATPFNQQVRGVNLGECENELKKIRLLIVFFLCELIICCVF